MFTNARLFTKKSLLTPGLTVQSYCSIKNLCPSHLSITKLRNNEITKLRNLFLIFFLVLGLIFLKKAKRSKYQDDHAIRFGTFEKFLAQNQKKYQE